MPWAICEASRPIAVTLAGEAARPLVSSKHFPPTAGGTGGIHTFRDGCGDEGRSAAENFNGALVAPINAAERRNFAGGKERWMGERSGGGAGRAGSWGKPVLRLAGLSAGRKSGAGAGEIQARRVSTQAQSRTSRRGLKPVKFGRDLALWLCDWNGRIQKYKRERLQK